MTTPLPQLARINQGLHCLEEVHCQTCMTDPAWRSSAERAWGMKLICPLGKVLQGETPNPPPLTVSARPAPAPLTPEQQAAQEEARKEAERARLAQYRFTTPGDRLHDIFESVGIKPTSSCACASKQRQMNDWWLAIEKEQPNADYATLMAEYRKLYTDNIVAMLKESAGMGWIPGAELAIKAALVLVFNRWVKAQGNLE